MGVCCLSTPTVFQSLSDRRVTALTLLHINIFFGELGRQTYTIMRKSILVFGLAALFASCGGSKKAESLTAKPETTEVKGALKGCYEVIQKDYTIKENGSWGHLISVELKRTDKELPFDPQKATSFSVSEDGKPIQVGFGIELLDENGDVVEIKNANAGGIGGAYSSDDIEAAIQLNTDETGIVRWTINADNKPVTFRITSAMERNTSTSNVSEEKTSSSNDWDSILDDYETYIDKYIKLYKKAKNGDMDALTEYPALLEKAQSLADKLSKAQSDFKPAQASRFLKLQQKLANAALE